MNYNRNTSEAGNIGLILLGLAFLLIIAAIIMAPAIVQSGDTSAAEVFFNLPELVQ